MLFIVGLFTLIGGLILTCICLKRISESKKGVTVEGVSTQSTLETIGKNKRQDSYYRTIYGFTHNNREIFIVDEVISAEPVPVGTKKEFIYNEFTGKHYSRELLNRQLKQSVSFIILGLLICIIYFLYTYGITYL